MMSLWDALRMNMMISYQELVRTFLSETSYVLHTLSLCDIQKIKHPLRAQCSPRHACPLKRSLLMQVHEPAQAAPVLAR
ncbi:hypothetical protein, partial [Escherichia coli]|uniref:hypothetical protein n=1 Tax=Escherichia coli TaxID=562 RepID=UPI001FF531FC